MDLKSWRSEKQLTLAVVARSLGLSGANPGRTLQRIETGEHAADADLVEDIEKLTHGAVRAADMQATRLAFLERSGRRREVPAEATV